MKYFILLGMLLLGSCSDPVKDAEKELKMLRDAKASPMELCEAEQKVVRVLLENHVEKDFKMRKMIADQQCLNAKMERELGLY